MHRDRRNLLQPSEPVEEVLSCAQSLEHFWKPVVLAWGLLSGMLLVSFVASSLLEGKDPFAPSATIAQLPSVKTGVAQAGQPKHSHKATRTPSQ
jgi:hypothetical protein